MNSPTIPRLSRLLVIAWIALVIPAQSLRAVESLPSQLSDAEFWKLINDASESDGAFFSDNLVSNERGFQYVLPGLLRKVQPGGVYLGVGPEQNFTYVAALQPRIAFIVDIRRQNMVELLLYKALFEMSPTREEFLSRLFSRRMPADSTADSDIKKLFDAITAAPLDEAFYAENLREVKNLLLEKHGFALTPTDIAGLERVFGQFARQGTSVGYSVSDPQLMDVINRRTGRVPLTAPPVTISVAPLIAEQGVITLLPNDAPTGPRVLVQAPPSFPNYADLMTATDGEGTNWSYLANDSNYEFVRTMQRQNRIVPLVGDFAGPKALKAVGEYLRAHQAELSVFYISNVEQYLSPASLKIFYENIATMPLASSSAFIRSAQGSGAQPGITQSSLSPIREVMDAVLEGRIFYQADILREWR
jgi:hypothetical protein